MKNLKYNWQLILFNAIILLTFIMIILVGSLTFLLSLVKNSGNIIEVYYKTNIITKDN